MKYSRIKCVYYFVGYGTQHHQTNIADLDHYHIQEQMSLSWCVVLEVKGLSMKPNLNGIKKYPNINKRMQRYLTFKQIYIIIFILRPHIKLRPCKLYLILKRYCLLATSQIYERKISLNIKMIKLFQSLKVKLLQRKLMHMDTMKYLHCGIMDLKTSLKNLSEHISLKRNLLLYQYQYHYLEKKQGIKS